MTNYIMVRIKIQFNNNTIKELNITEENWVQHLIDTTDYLSIIYLNCHTNQLTSLPNEIGNLTNLQILYCSNNELTSLPNEIGNLINLRELNCRNNYLTSLPKEIGNLINLRILDCYYNQLTSFPKEIGNLINLQDLDCGNNRLKSLPEEICNLTNLQRLWCEYNGLASLPKKIDNLTNLQIFCCSDNQFTSLPIEFLNFYKKRVFNCNYNPIDYVPPNVGRLVFGIKNISCVYSDEQNNHNIQESICNSINNLFSVKPDVNYLIAAILDPSITNCGFFVLDDNILTDECKQLLVNYSNDKTIHSVLNITFEELLASVWHHIQINEHRDKIKRVLNEEMMNATCKCYTCRLSQLVNCLNGFTDLVSVGIAKNEQIENIIIETDYTTNKHKGLFRRKINKRLSFIE